MRKRRRKKMKRRRMGTRRKRKRKMRKKTRRRMRKKTRRKMIRKMIKRKKSHRKYPLNSESAAAGKFNYRNHICHFSSLCNIKHLLILCWFQERNLDYGSRYRSVLQVALRHCRPRVL